jgi:signal transduction histidine kinase
MRYRASNTADFFAENVHQDYNYFYQSCINYAKSYSEKDKLELQFIDVNGKVVATSYGDWMDESPATQDIDDAFSSRDIGKFVGRDPVTGERVMAISKAMIYNNGEVIGVLRYVTSTKLVDRQIAFVAMCALLALSVVVLVVVLSSSYYIRSIIVPMSEITKKAQRIAAGSYGSQIQTKYDDEIGELADTINDLSLQISQNEKVQRDFISSLSHELRTPLTSITGWSETLLAGDTLDPDTRRGMRIILREGKRLTEMVLDLLDFNRIQDGRMTLNM